MEANIKKEEFPSRGKSYNKDVITLKGLSNAQYIKLLMIDPTDIKSIEDKIDSFLSGGLIEYDYDEIEIGDKYFIYNKLKEMSALSKDISFSKITCEDGHLNNKVTINIIDDVHVKYIDESLELIETFEASTGFKISLTTPKIGLAKNFKKKLIAAIPQGMEDISLDEEIIALACLITNVDPLNAYNLFTGEIIPNIPMFTHEDINKIIDFVNSRDFGLDTIKIPCCHEGCERSLYFDPFLLLIGYLQTGKS